MESDGVGLCQVFSSVNAEGITGIFSQNVIRKLVNKWKRRKISRGIDLWWSQACRMKIKVAITIFLPTNLSYHFSWWFYEAESHINALEEGIGKPSNRHNSCKISGESALDKSKPQRSICVGNKYHGCEKNPQISLLSFMSLIWWNHAVVFKKI